MMSDMELLISSCFPPLHESTSSNPRTSHPTHLDRVWLPSRSSREHLPRGVRTNEQQTQKQQIGLSVSPNDSLRIGSSHIHWYLMDMRDLWPLILEWKPFVLFVQSPDRVSFLSAKCENLRVMLPELFWLKPDAKDPDGNKGCISLLPPTHAS